jgi:hypothetical protein
MALRGLRMEPVGLVTACRRIVERHPTSGPLWSLCARALTAADPFAEVSRVADEAEDDPTPGFLYEQLPDNARVCVIGWPDVIGEAIVRRGDLSVLCVDVRGEGTGFVRRLQRADVDADVVDAPGMGAAAAASDLVLLEPSATGPGELLCVTGSRAVAAVAYCAELPVWAVAGAGRRLPAPLWNSVVSRLENADDPWALDDEIVPAGLVSHVVGPFGFVDGTSDLDRVECPIAQELTKVVVF